MTDRLLCQSCDQPKLNLKTVKSKLAPWELHMCTGCIDSRLEPRFVIILAARAQGLTPKISEYIKKRRYLGEDIPASYIL